MEARLLSKPALRAWVSRLPHSFVVASLLGGDRLSCCDEAVGIEVEGEVVAVATIAPCGEICSGEPTIVGVYCLPSHRRHGYGRAAFVAAIKRCRERGFARVCVDSMSAGMRRIIDGLDENDRAYLHITDHGSIMDAFPEN